MNIMKMMVEVVQEHLSLPLDNTANKAHHPTLDNTIDILSLGIIAHQKVDITGLGRYLLERRG
jgi:hypothetical protein